MKCYYTVSIVKYNRLSVFEFPNENTRKLLLLNGVLSENEWNTKFELRTIPAVSVQ